jgi:hypothetical protein
MLLRAMEERAPAFKAFSGNWRMLMSMKPCEGN